MISATPKILMMLLAPESHIKQRFKWKACFWLSGGRRPQREEPWRRTWDNTSSPGSELCTGLKRRQLLGDIRGRPVSTTLLSPLQLQPTRTVNYHRCPPACPPTPSLFQGLQQFGVTSETLLCLGPILKEFPPSVCQTPSLCKPGLWSMQLHAHVDTLTRKH